MAPTKSNKPTEVNPWGWCLESTVPLEEIGDLEVLKAYRIVDYKLCEEPRRNCRRNPFCYWGLGEKKWVQGEGDGEEDEDNVFREEGEFAGLQNLGATCYVNSLLQLWFHNPILRPAILRWQPAGKRSQDIATYRPNGPVAQLQAMFARMKTSKRSKIDPTEFVNSLKLDTGEQQDAQEFSKLFMDVIMKKLSEYEDAAVRDAVATAFNGELQYETECCTCNNVTARPESFTELELGVCKNLQESLNELLGEEVLSGDEQYFCSNCQTKRDAKRRLKLLHLPPVLNLQLMRFVFDRETLRKKKVTTTMQFPEVLDLTDRVSPMSARNRQNGAIFVYQLTAVLIHNGPSASSGHYVAQIKDLRTGAWHKFNDETVDRVGKGKSQKLVLKEDDANGSGSDSEKTKQKKTNPGDHTSQGAYMLVYTMDRYVEHPEPDPELWNYLEQMIKTEDLAYEEEMLKTKTDKENESNLRELRKQDIHLLYPTLDLGNGTEKSPPREDEHESPDSGEPPKKMPRSEKPSNNRGKEETEPNPRQKEERELRNGVNGRPKRRIPSPARNCVSASNPASIRNGRKPEVTQPRSPSVPSVDKLEFIPADWLRQWLDPTNSPPPLDNTMLICEHYSLRPPSPNSNSCLYKAVPSSFVDVLEIHYGFEGKRLQGRGALCTECVKLECEQLRKLHELEEDYKRFLELNKAFETFLNRDQDGGRISEDGDFSPHWLSKEAIKNWKRTAKSNIEKPRSSPCVWEVDDNAETESEVVLEAINKDLVCEHNKLVPESSGPPRKLIPKKSWDIIKKHFEKAVALPADQVSECLQCEDAKQGKDRIKETMKEKATLEKAQLSDLFALRNRPSMNENGIVYVISKDFLVEWKRFIRDPMRNEPVGPMKNGNLLCDHQLFKHPFEKVIELKDQAEIPYDDIFVLVYPEEWAVISNQYRSEISIEVRISKSDGVRYTYKPEICGECSENWWYEMYHARFVYTDKPIHIVRREIAGLEDQRNSPTNGSDKEEDDDDLFVKGDIIPGKRERKQRDPMQWTKGFADSLKKDDQGLRRSARPRKQRGEKSYRLSSSTKLRDLKLMITRDFHIFLSDQHLFLGDKELVDDQKTLEELEILPDTTLFLEVDPEAKDQDDPTPSRIETGFMGTALMGDERDALLQVEN